MDSRHRSNSFLAPEEIPHLAAIEKLESEFIYKMTYSWLLCACHKRLNNNSFHVHHTGVSLSEQSKKIFLYGRLMVFAQGWMTEHHRAVLDQTAASKRSNAVMSVFCL